MSKGTLGGPPSSKWCEMLPLHKVLTQDCSETFSQDTSLVREIREEYLKRHLPNFTMENTCDLSNIFQCMAETAKLLSLAIYEIKEVWKEADELQQANYALRTLPKGLKFLRAVPPLESPKVMALMGIHDLDALCHFNGMTHCPWCGKEGQNEGTIINHLWVVHYRLDLMCKKCYSYHLPHQTPSSTTASRTANPQEREALMSYPCWHNCQQEEYRVNLS